VAVVDLAGITVARIADEPQGRAGFRCGNPEVDRWLRDDAVVVDRLPGFRVTAARDGTRVVGCYLLNALQVEARPTDGGVVARSTAMAADVEQSVLPALLLSRVAVDMGWQGAGLATALVWHALRAVMEASSPLGVRLLVTRDHDTGGGFCRRFGFTPLPGPAGLAVPAESGHRSNPESLVAVTSRAPTDSTLGRSPRTA
jgi:GNAT superfamily N-acetyltransferase